jgi:GNAT superfamily N-acetyltransferase
MTIRRATAGDIAALTAFGRRVFAATFGPDNDAADLQAYLDDTYNEQRQRTELDDPGIDTLLLESDGELAAFAQLRDATPGDGVTGPTPIELRRFYVDARWHGRGVAGTLLAETESAARGRGARTLWLGVWERNLRAQAFYRKRGFTVVGSQIFVLGSDPQRDLVMAKPL